MPEATQPQSEERAMKCAGPITLVLHEVLRNASVGVDVREVELPPVRRMRAISASTGALLGARLMTQFEITTSTELQERSRAGQRQAPHTQLPKSAPASSKKDLLEKIRSSFFQKKKKKKHGRNKSGSDWRCVAGSTYPRRRQT